MDKHLAPIPAVATSCRNQQVVAGSYDGRVSKWVLEDQLKLAQITDFPVHSKGINHIAMFEHLTLTGASDGHALLLDNNLSVKSRYFTGGDVEATLFSGDGEHIALGGTNGKLFIFETATEKLIKEIFIGKTISCLALSHQTNKFILGSNDKKIRLISWDGIILKELTKHEGPVKALAKVPGGFISTSHDCQMLLFDKELNFLSVATKFPTTVKSLAVSPSGKYLFVGCYSQNIMRYAINKQMEMVKVNEIYSPLSWPHGIAALSDDLVVVGSFGGTPKLIDFSTGTQSEDKDFAVPCLSSATAGAASIFSAGDSGIIYLTQERDAGATDAPAIEILELPGCITSLKGTEEDLIAATWPGKIYRYSNNKLVWITQVEEDLRSPILSIAKHPNIGILAGFYTNGFALFDQAGKVVWHNFEASGAVKSVDLAKTFFCVTGRYDPLRIGDSKTGKIFARIALDTPVSDVTSISPFIDDKDRNSQLIAVCAGNNTIWFVKTNPEEQTAEIVFKSNNLHSLPIKSIVWASPDSVLAGDYNGDVVLHSINSAPKLIRRINCRLGVSALVRTTSHSGTSRFWAATFDGTISEI